MVEATLDTYAAGLLVPGHLGNANGRPTPVNGHRVYGVLLKLPHWALGSQTSSIRKSTISLHKKPRNGTAGEPFINRIVTQTSTSSTLLCCWWS